MNVSSTLVEVIAQGNVVVEFMTMQRNWPDHPHASDFTAAETFGDDPADAIARVTVDGRVVAEIQASAVTKEMRGRLWSFLAETISSKDPTR